MARIFSSQTLIRLSLSASPTVLHKKSRPLVLSPRMLTQRHRWNKSGKAQLVEIDLESDNGDVEVLGLRKLEDVIHNIIVKRSAPDWLPFRPGSSYWVPPRLRGGPNGVVEVIGRLTNPLTEEEAKSFSSVRGWPSSAFFIEGTSSVRPIPLEMEVEVKVHNIDKESRTEDEE